MSKNRDKSAPNGAERKIDYSSRVDYSREAYERSPRARETYPTYEEFFEAGEEINRTLELIQQVKENPGCTLGFEEIVGTRGAERAKRSVEEMEALRTAKGQSKTPYLFTYEDPPGRERELLILAFNVLDADSRFALEFYPMRRLPPKHRITREVKNNE